MKKIVLLIFLMISINLFSTEKSDLEILEFKGKIKSVIKNTYSAKTNGLAEVNVFIFDKNGNKLRNSQKKWGRVKYDNSYKYEFHKNGNIKRKEAKNGKKMIYFADYNENGYKKTEAMFNKYGKKKFSFNYSFDAKGNRLFYERVDKRGKLSARYEYKYDENSRIINEKYIDRTGKLKLDKNLEYKLNKDGKIINIRYLKLNSLNMYYFYNEDVFEYDKYGNLVKESLKINKYSKGEVKNYTLKLFENGKIKERLTSISKRGKKAVNKLKEVFNSKGETVEEVRYDRKGNKRKRFTFTYDDKSNKKVVNEYFVKGKKETHLYRHEYIYE